jgi:hypothetical protein
MREQGVPMATMEGVDQAWRRGDDDILPVGMMKKRGRR